MAPCLSFLIGVIVIVVTITIVAGSNTSSTSTQDNQHKHKPSVVVIGAGVAGLTAAATLHATDKFNVTVLEAMSRIGGRTHTLRFDNGHHIEMGAEWIHGKEGNPVYDLVSPLGLVNAPEDVTALLDRFQTASDTVLNETMVGLLWEIYEKVETDPVSEVKPTEWYGSFGELAKKVLDAFQEKVGLHQGARFRAAVLDWLHRVTLASNSADNWFEISAHQDGEEFSYVTWKPPYGYWNLHQLILTGNVTESARFPLPDWIRLGKEVLTIDYTNQELVRVCTRDGACFMADHVIVTPSLGVLKARHDTLFSPPLPLRKRLAIRSLGFGTATKYYLEFSAPWWPANFSGVFPLWDDIDYDYDDQDPSWMYWRSNIKSQELLADVGGFPLWTRAVCRIFTVDSGSHPNMLRAWVTGPASRFMDSWASDQVRTAIMRLVRRFMGVSVIPAPIAVHQSKWASNPFTRGVYSFRSVESDKNGVTARDLTEPILGAEADKPIVCFAGEATHSTAYATVHGAYETGLREAERIKSWYASVGSGTENSVYLALLALALIFI